MKCFSLFYCFFATAARGGRHECNPPVAPRRSGRVSPLGPPFIDVTLPQGYASPGQLNKCTPPFTSSFPRCVILLLRCSSTWNAPPCSSHRGDTHRVTSSWLRLDGEITHSTWKISSSFIHQPGANARRRYLLSLRVSGSSAYTCGWAAHCSEGNPPRQPLTLAHLGASPFVLLCEEAPWWKHLLCALMRMVLCVRPRAQMPLRMARKRAGSRTHH